MAGVLTRIVVCALAGALLWLGAAAAQPAEADAAQCKRASKPAHQLARKTARRATLCLINRQRTSRGLPRLRENGAQRQAALKHSRVMIKKRCFSHQCPGEKSLVERIAATAYLPCGCSWSIGENIAYGTGPTSSPRRIVRAWMASPGHRANILKRSYQHIGMGILPGSPTGVAKAATYTTTFGSRR